MIAFRVPDPYALWSGDKEVAVLIHLDTIGYSIVFPAWLLAKNAAVGKGSIGGDVIHANVSFLAVVDVEVAAIR